MTRLFNLQILNYKLYSQLSTKNQLVHLPIEPNRGLIYDRNGILLAENLPRFSLDIATKHAKNIGEIIEKLKAIIEITPNEIKRFKKAFKNRRRSEYITIKNRLTKEEVVTFYVKQYRFPGIIINTKMIRHYPLSQITVNALGYVGKINERELKKIDTKNYSIDNFIGKVGIEKYYEKILRGRMGYKVIEVDAIGRIIRTLKITPPIPGKTLHLTIDSKLQKVAQDALDNEKGAVVAIDPNNGEVLALVSNPGYDPNMFALGIDHPTFNKLQKSKDKPMYNRATKGQFPLASTIKPIIALQGLDTEVIDTKFRIKDPGWFRLENSKHTYRDWKYGGHGKVNITKAIMESCDTFFYTLGVKLGIKRIDDILERFNFGKKTGIDIHEESYGIVASPQWKRKYNGKPWYKGDTVISSIGQGFMATTTIQLAQSIATIAMRGERFKPHLLLATQKLNDNKVINMSSSLTPVTLKNPENWEIVINAMKQVTTNPRGTAYRHFGRRLAYTVAGKTGGAQLFRRKIVNEYPTPEDEEKIPKRLRNHRLFIAFAPIEDPTIAIAVITENSNKATRAARKILDYYFRSK